MSEHLKRLCVYSSSVSDRAFVLVSGHTGIRQWHRQLSYLLEAVCAT